jgi:hypothetical protein
VRQSNTIRIHATYLGLIFMLYSHKNLSPFSNPFHATHETSRLKVLAPLSFIWCFKRSVTRTCPAILEQLRIRRFSITEIIKMAVFWVAAPCSLVEVYQRFKGACCLHHHRPDDGGSKDLWNVSKLLPDYTALQPKRQPSSYSPPWEPLILLNRNGRYHGNVPTE